MALLYCFKAKKWRCDTSLLVSSGVPTWDGTIVISKAPMEITACRIDSSASDIWSTIRFHRTESRYPLRWGAV
jgi:hypothetical protein